MRPRLLHFRNSGCLFDTLVTPLRRRRAIRLAEQIVRDPSQARFGHLWTTRHGLVPVAATSRARSTHVRRSR